MSDTPGFLKFDREEAPKRPVAERKQDWKEFLLPFPQPRLKEQASRCMDCGVPFCHTPPGCPLENVIPEWNQHVARNQWRKALEVLHSTNNFPEMTGKLCPAPCESACVLGINSPAVTIKSIELAIIEKGFDEGWVEPQIPTHRTGRKIAVIGSGPAGLAAAQQLARAGHEVHVYEKADRIGGLLRYGIPDFKLEKHILDQRLEQMEAEGVRFFTRTEIGVDLSFSDLQARHDAVCLATGAEAPRDIQIPGRELGGIHFAMDYLVQQNRRIAGDILSQRDEITAAGKRVVILGGGDTGSDCLGTAHRQGCLEVSQIEIQGQPPVQRASLTPWPEWPHKMRTSHAHEEGGTRLWGISTREFVGVDGQVKKIRYTQTNAPSNSAEVLGLEADLVLIAAGFIGPQRRGLFEQLPLALDSRGNVQVDREFMTSIPGVFAAGDAHRGASLIVWAIAEGRKMAAAVDRFVMQSKLQIMKGTN